MATENNSTTESSAKSSKAPAKPSTAGSSKKQPRAGSSKGAVPLLAFGAMFLGICTISYLATGEQKTFYSLLLMLQDVPAIDFGWLDFGTVALELPAALAWLEVVVQFLAEVVQVVGFFLAGIAQALLFVLHFLRWIFL